MSYLDLESTAHLSRSSSKARSQVLESEEAGLPQRAAEGIYKQTLNVNSKLVRAEEASLLLLRVARIGSGSIWCDGIIQSILIT